jgi:hypothetical protein
MDHQPPGDRQSRMGGDNDEEEHDPDDDRDVADEPTSAPDAEFRIAAAIAQASVAGLVTLLRTVVAR